ncbi:hypothetical protein MHK_008501 [Candidatus Magnetomorum sp. HK-1]|nr:hypothetical protein MHK_008501 [Candidatus Magnetomorum sp. HK-1]
MIKNRITVREVNKFLSEQMLFYRRNAHKDKKFRTMLNLIKENKSFLSGKIFEILNQSGKDKYERYNEARQFVYQQALNNVPEQHLFRNVFRISQHENIPYEILDQSKIESVINREVLYKHQSEVFRTIIKCAELKQDQTIAYLKLFSDEHISGLLTNTNSYDAIHHKITKHYNKLEKTDISLRLRTMVWFIYFLIDIAVLDNKNLCKSGPAYLKSKLRNLFDEMEKENIAKINDSGYEKGKWENSFFAFLQGIDKKSFVDALLKQFNEKDQAKNINRKLKFSIRQCMYQNIYQEFCKKHEKEYTS